MTDRQALVFISAVGLFSAGACCYLAWRIGQLYGLVRFQRETIRGQSVVIEAFVRDGAEMHCVVCGNPLDPTDEVDVIQQVDGKVLVAHSSHRLPLWQ